MNKYKPYWNEQFDCPQEDVDELDAALMDLVSRDLVSLSIDEDGEYCFTITEKGLAYYEANE